MDNDYAAIYCPSSTILIITICSFTKKKGGSQTYDYDASILKSLDNVTREKLLNGRKAVFDHLWRGDFQSQGISAKELEYNKMLQFGKDFGGSETVGLYLPALARYNGRFYAALGKEGKIKAIKSKHHFLILSGLYGLLSPLESIQLYSVPIERDSIVQKIWKNEDLLTEVLVKYVKSNQIQRIFDFTSRGDYRELVNWKALSRITGAQVFHCFSIHASGADSLRFFGEFLRDYLFQASEEELINIDHDTVKEGILLRIIPQTLDSLPKEHEILLKMKQIPVSSEWSWFTYFTPQFFRDFENLGGVEEKSNILRHLMEIQRQPDIQVKDIQKPYSGDKKGRWRKRVSKSHRLTYSIDHESRRITIHEILHK